MRLTIAIVLVFLVSTISCSRGKNHGLFVFVGSLIPASSPEKNAEGYVKLKYRILEKTYGEYDGDTIGFWAYYDADRLKFTKYKHCLLFLDSDDGDFTKLAFPVYDVYQTQAGRWAAGAQWWDYDPGKQTAIKPRRLSFRDPVSFDLTGMEQDEIDHWYPSKYYERKGNAAIPVFGSYTDELLEINKRVLSSYFPSEKRYLEQQQIDEAVSGWQKAGILEHLSPQQIALSKERAVKGRCRDLNEVIVHFPDVVYWFDTELENLNDPYAEFVRKLSAISHGAFRPEHIADDFSAGLKSGTTLRFSLNKKEYVKTLKARGDWMDTRVFDFIKEVVTENKIDGQFYQLYEGGQGGIVIFLTPEQYQYLKEKELVLFVEE